MAKVMIVEKTQKGIKVVETNVPFEDIEKFIDKYIAEHNGEGEKKDCGCKFHNEFECIMAQKHPEFYEHGKADGVYDDEFFDALADMAEEMGFGPEDMVDGLVHMATSNPMNAALMATALVMAKAKHAAKKE